MRDGMILYADFLLMIVDPLDPKKTLSEFQTCKGCNSKTFEYLAYLIGNFLAFLPGNVQKWIFVAVRLESNSVNEMAAGVCQGVGGALGYFPHCTIFIQ